MNYADTTGVTIRDAFNKFHAENPTIYMYFKQYASQMLSSGCKKISSKLIINRIRWEIYIETKGEGYRINDAFTAWYAREFVKDYPEHRDKFEFRKIRSRVGDRIDHLYKINDDGRSEMVLNG